MAADKDRKDVFEIVANIIANDVKKVVAIAHGYISLMRLDIEEDTLHVDQLENYIAEMETMFESSYLHLDNATQHYRNKFDD